MTDKTISFIKRIKDWYLMEHGHLYKGVWCYEAPSYASPVHANKLVLFEIAYQIVIHGVGGILYQGKKVICPPLYAIYRHLLIRKHQASIKKR
jgi:hypothetical protein